MPNITVEFLGGATFRIITESGDRLSIDPRLDEEVGCPLRQAEIEELDLLLLTHGGTAHAREAVPFAKRPGCDVIFGQEVKY